MYREKKYTIIQIFARGMREFPAIPFFPRGNGVICNEIVYILLFKIKSFATYFVIIYTFCGKKCT